MIPMEIFTLLGGALSGFIFKMLAQQAADRAEQHKMWMESIKTKDESANSAAKRVPNDGPGNWIRRVIVISILFGVILAPFILSIIGKSTIVEIDYPVKPWLFGLFSTGGNTRFYELFGYLLSPEIRNSLLAVIGYYFGQASARRT